MNINAIISARILANLAAGMTVAQAIDNVLGEGTHSKIASDLYDAFQERA